MLAILLIGCVEYGMITPPKDALAPVNPGVLDPGNPDPFVATAPVYANTFDTLFEVEPETGAILEIGQFHDAEGTVENFVDIAIDMDGYMVGGTYDGLYRIHPETAEVELLCETSVDMLALTFTPGGNLVAGGERTLLLLDVETCATQPLIQESFFETSGDLVGLPDGYLYWTVRGEDGDELVRLDAETAMWAWVGKIGAERLYGLGYDDGDLFGFSSNGEIIAISPETGAGHVRSTNQSMSWWGATTNPVAWQ